ncbi:MAG: metallophosphoesterase [Planctomycetaceae bacterium]
MFDIIGDVHGHADELIVLLETMGYREINGIYRHPDRRAIFCGDFIDRGPRIRDVLSIARGMVQDESAMAVMGNHEFNAIAFHTPRSSAANEFFRSHSDRNTNQHKATLDQLSQKELESAIDWFRTLPVALDMGSLRVVHACWDPGDISTINSHIQNHGAFTERLLELAVDEEADLFNSVERVLKGPELRLPDGLTVTDKEGCHRRQIRIRWFDPTDGHTVGTYSLPSIDRSPLQDIPIPPSFNRRSVPIPYPKDAPPVFFGHYWMPDRVPQPLRRNVACLDYSIAKDGFLCAYRFDGEQELSPDKFVSIKCTAAES